MIGSARLERFAPGESGFSCLAMCAWLLGDRIEPIGLRMRLINVQTSTAAQVSNLASAMGLSARPLRCEIEQLRSVRLPAILQWGRDRFVVLQRMTASGGARIFNPALGWQKVSAEQLDEKFSGIALEVSAIAGFERPREKPPISAFSLLNWSSSTRRNLARVLLITLLVQVYVVVGPLYGRMIIDEVIPNSDLQLAGTLATGFAILALFNSTVTLLREFALQQLNSMMNWDLTRSLFKRLIHLPLDWFQQRTTADVLQNMASGESISQFYSKLFAAIFIDGFIAVVSVVVLMLFAPGLAAISIAVVFAYVGIRLVAVPINKALQTKSLDTAVIDKGNRMDTVRAIQTIKSMASESAREADWTTKYAQNIQTTIDSAAASNTFTAIQGAISALATIAVFYVGARAVIAGELTIGLLTAAIAYEVQFSSRAAKLFEQYIAWRMLDVHLMRVADLALAKPEEGFDKPLGDVRAIKGALEARDISFRYGPDTPLVLNKLSFHVDAGEHLALMGPSGIGKSTLIKVLCSLYRPTSGSVLLDGKPLEFWGPRTVRTAMGVVLQNDQLLYGSVADNVSFFQPELDVDWLWECLEAAGIRKEIERLPLRERSAVGELGQMLSGGQKQRLFLARVLYKRPRLLILDEATSHLDVALEKGILSVLRRMNTTVIMVAHRAETVAHADRVLHLTSDGIRGVTSPAQPGAAKTS